MSRRLTVLVAAYACSPRRGSEAGVGWGWVEAIAKHHDLCVIAGDEEPFPDGVYRYRDEIEEQLSRQPELRPRIRFYHIHKTRWVRLERIWPPSYLWFYRRWQRLAYELAVRLHCEHRFDLVHQLTYVGYRVPGHFRKLRIPLVWGPIGGLENTPWRFLPTLGVRTGSYYAARNLLNSLQRRFLPGPKRAFAKAAATDSIIAATEGIRREIKKWYGHDSEVICEIGPPDEIASDHCLRNPGEPLKLAWSGRHDAGKCLPLLLKALALLPSDLPWHLTILGHGPDTARWQRLSRRLGLDGRCRWTGWLERDVAVRTLHDAHVFVITSLKDLTSTVLLEALSQGLPVICPDHCGFTNVVTPDCGIRLPVHSPKQLIADLAAAIHRLAHDEPHRRLLASGALRRIHDFSWDKKAAAVDAIYRRAVEAWKKDSG